MSLVRDKDGKRLHVKSRLMGESLVTTGGGTRSRHIYTIGLEMGMPTGIIARFGSMISEQNALMVATLLSPWGGVKISHSDIVKLPTYFAEGIIPVMHGMPPYDYFAIKPRKGRIPIHRTDVGLVVLGDLIGSKTILFIKDEDGLFTADPKKDSDAQFIPKIGAQDLIDLDLDDLVIERPCLEIIQNSEVIESVQIINGMVPGNISRALKGEHVGTIIYKQ